MKKKICCIFREKCLIRQCARVNPKYSNRGILEDHLSTTGLVNTPCFLEDSIEAPGDPVCENSSHEIVFALVEDLIVESIDTSNANLESNSGSSQSINRVQYRSKVYPCPRCQKLFAQFTSAKKHCSVVKASKSSVCANCYKSLLTKNMKTHLKSCIVPKQSPPSKPVRA